MARPKDIEKRKEAFKLYRKYNNLTKVADELSISQSMVSVWKKEDDWDKKLLEAQALLRTRLTLKETSENTVILKEDETALEVCNYLNDIVLEKVYNGDIEPTTWNEVVSTLRYTAEQKRLLLGQPTVRTEKTISIDVQGLDNDELNRKLEETQRAIALLEPGKD